MAIYLAYDAGKIYNRAIGNFLADHQFGYCLCNKKCSLK